MLKKTIFIICLAMSACFAYSQNSKTDTLPAAVDNSLAMDTSMDYDDLMDDLSLFLDSILAPHSYFLVNLSVGQGYFNFTNKNNTNISSTKKFTWTPTVGYYAKGGFGATLTGYMVNDSVHLNLYQLSFSPSYDFLKNRNLAAGLAYIRYFTKDSLRFYTSPLQNEINGYFLWRKSWLQPGIAVNYGWGSRKDYQKQLKFLKRLRIRYYQVTTTEESVNDFSLTASLRHDFYWLGVFSSKDYIKFNPQLSFSSGTQKFGFNQTSGTYGVLRNNVLFNAGNVNLDDKVKFQPLSLTFYLRGEYSIGKFFLQPQMIFDYYFPAESKNLTTLFSINAGFMF
jgi:hypothetical protein